jgi:hypothetical protein
MLDRAYPLNFPLFSVCRLTSDPSFCFTDLTQHNITIINNIEMKLALATVLVASASAFAPSSMNSVS